MYLQIPVKRFGKQRNNAVMMMMMMIKRAKLGDNGDSEHTIMVIMLSFVSQIQNILSIRLTHSENIELTSFKFRLECLSDGNPAPTYRSQTFKTQISLFFEKQDSFLIKLDFRWFKDDDTTTVRCHSL